jgi:hypothetical protein
VCINGVEINPVYVAVFLRMFMWRNFSYFEVSFRTRSASFRFNCFVNSYAFVFRVTSARWKEGM